MASNIAPMERGPCCGCGAPDSALHMHIASMGGWTGPWCNPCSGPLWAKQRAERTAATKARQEKARQEGIAFWQARGIQPGDPVTVFGSHLLYGRFPIHGTACVGKSGAYVSSPSYPRRPLDPSSAIPRNRTEEAA